MTKAFHSNASLLFSPSSVVKAQSGHEPLGKRGVALTLTRMLGKSNPSLDTGVDNKKNETTNLHFCTPKEVGLLCFIIPVLLTEHNLSSNIKLAANVVLWSVELLSVMDDETKSIKTSP